MTIEELREYNKGRRIFQIGIVVKDIDESVKKWTEEYKVGPWTILTHSNEFLQDSMNKPEAADAEWRFTIGLAMIGDVQIELIAPEYGIPLYEEFLERCGDGSIHHFKEIMPDDEMNAQIEYYESKGAEMVFGGNFYGARFAYPRTKELFGTQIELGNGMPAQTPETYTLRRMYPEE